MTDNTKLDNAQNSEVGNTSTTKCFKFNGDE